MNWKTLFCIAIQMTLPGPEPEAGRAAWDWRWEGRMEFAKHRNCRALKQVE